MRTAQAMAIPHGSPCRGTFYLTELPAVAEWRKSSRASQGLSQASSRPCHGQLALRGQSCKLFNPRCGNKVRTFTTIDGLEHTAKFELTNESVGRDASAKRLVGNDEANYRPRFMDTSTLFYLGLRCTHTCMRLKFVVSDG